MNTHEIIKPTGMLRVVVIGPDGQVKTDEVFKNLVVDAGKDFVASRMVAASATVMSHMGIGSDTTAPAAGDTTLGSQQPDERQVQQYRDCHAKHRKRYHHKSG